MSGSSSSSSSSSQNQHLEIEGTNGPFRWTFNKNSCVVRVDVPGSTGVPSQFVFGSDNVRFSVNEPTMDNPDHTERAYRGFVKFNKTIYDPSAAKVMVVNGVLRITVPKK